MMRLIARFVERSKLALYIRRAKELDPFDRMSLEVYAVFLSLGMGHGLIDRG